MAASDTVMSWERMRMILHDKTKPDQDGLFRFETVCEAQADISFKAGIKLVVDFVSILFEISEEDGAMFMRSSSRNTLRAWQTQLKDWGIEPQDTGEDDD